MSRAIVAVLVVALLASGGGCSWSFVERVPDPPTPQWMPTCTAHRGSVMVDGLLAASLGLVAIAISDLEDGQDGDVLAAAFGIPAALFAASGFMGMSRTDDCREARAAHERWLLEQRGRPVPLVPASPAPPGSGPPGAPR